MNTLLRSIRRVFVDVQAVRLSFSPIDTLEEGARFSAICNEDSGIRFLNERS